LNPHLQKDGSRPFADVEPRGKHYKLVLNWLTDCSRRGRHYDQIDIFRLQYEYRVLIVSRKGQNGIEEDLWPLAHIPPA